MAASNSNQVADKGDQKSDKKFGNKKNEGSKKPIVIQGLDEDGDNPINNNNEDEEPDAPEVAGNHRIDVIDFNNNSSLQRQNSLAQVR